MKEQLGDAVTKVAVSTRLTDAPSAVTTEGPVSLEMERLMSQMPDGMGEVKSQRVLELNAKHPVFQVLKDAQSAGDAEKVKLYAETWTIRRSSSRACPSPIRSPMRTRSRS